MNHLAPAQRDLQAKMGDPLENIRDPQAVIRDPQAVMDHHAKSFSWAAKFLSSKARSDAALLYAFARTADDYADEEHLGSAQERAQALQILRSQALQPAQQTESLAGQTGHMLRRHGVPDAVLAMLMDSLQADAGPRHIDSTEDLLKFAYGVAGTVGQMMRPLLGAPSQADAYAIALGVGMQLTNIARDVVEDAQRGRCYIPAQWGVSPQVLATPQNTAQRAQAFAALRRLLALADDFYVFAHAGISVIPRHNRRAIRIASALYQGIGHKILRLGDAHYWDGRVSLTNAEKIRLLSHTLLLPTMPGKVVARDVWHNDLSHLAGMPGFPAMASTSTMAL
jgi:15-cis-phytoene synthase